MKGLKTTKQLKLPDQKAVKALQTSRQTIADYAKYTPANSVESVSPMILALRRKR